MVITLAEPEKYKLIRSERKWQIKVHDLDLRHLQLANLSTLFTVRVSMYVRLVLTKCFKQFEKLIKITWHVLNLYFEKFSMIEYVQKYHFRFEGNNQKQKGLIYVHNLTKYEIFCDK